MLKEKEKGSKLQILIELSSLKSQYEERKRKLCYITNDKRP